MDFILVIFNWALYGNNFSISHFASINREKIYYKVYGNGDPLLLLYGNNENIASFSEQIGPLAKKFQVIAVNTRGHGNNTANYTALYSYDLFAEDMTQLMDTLGLKDANILGWSDGGYTGLQTDYPEKYRSLCTS